ncbi:hypothetical protein K7X08_014757 [Anisodus acutangulus]|uniref:Uncharacterized protein n=1 Tax=Anisodus acutangulus TaxID=402998 RepID=A0A9Q1LMQ2_9SOLA|nr:hypothetical protein K7X08_014757 [Anisodus acutangulus]
MECLHPEKKVKRIIWKRSKEKSNGEDSAEDGTSLMKMEGHVKKRPHSNSMTSDLDGPCMMSLVPLPSLEECNSGDPVILTGTACKGTTGPPVGVVDIGVSSSAYYFRIALPGVKKDPGEFNCEIEKFGKVLIRGVTSTGGRTVSRYSRVFNMKIQQQCPSGAFTVSFSLPGPVDPTLFSPNFRARDKFLGVSLPGGNGFAYKIVLPDVARNLRDLSVDVQYNGQVEVEGIVSSGEITGTSAPVMLNRRTRRIFPPGHFTINFYLPGSAEP